MASTVIEKIKGKMFANPRPVVNIPTNVVIWLLEKMSRIPISAMRHETLKNAAGFVQLRIMEPRSLPTRMAMKKKALPFA